MLRGITGNRPLRGTSRLVIWSLLLSILTIVSPIASAPKANAAASLTSTSMSLTPISWNIIGLDSNSVTSGPNIFPVGVKLCNVSGASITPTFTFAWTTGGASAGGATAINYLGSATLNRGSLAASACTYAFWSVQVTRARASYDQTRKYSITASITGESVNTDPDIALKVEKLVSQNRNTISSVSFSNDIPSVGNTATVKMTGQTSTDYNQMTAWPVMDFSKVQVNSISFNYDKDSSADLAPPLDRFYANGCNWNFLTNACIGTGGAGGNLSIQMQVVRIAAGSLSASGVIYDFSGSSYHYNQDYGTAGVLTQANITAVGAGSNIAVNDSYTTPYETAITGDVSANDTTVGTYSFTKLTDPSAAAGSVTAFNTSTGAFTFTPTAGYSGTASFTYKLCDNASPPVCVNATVTITISPNPTTLTLEAVNDSYTGEIDTDIVGDVSGNDTTFGTYSFNRTSTPSHGSVTSFNTSSGAFTYTPNSGYSGSDSFTYDLCNAVAPCTGATSTKSATVTITINPADPAPTPTVVRIPQPPYINKITKSFYCSPTFDITIQGRNLYGATASIGGTALETKRSTYESLTVVIPESIKGKKTIVVTNYDGSDSYEFNVDRIPPKFTEEVMAQAFVDEEFLYLFNARGATSYKLDGELPPGLTYNLVDGTLSGTPTEDGLYTFVLTATGSCGSTEQEVNMYVDLKIPNAISHRIKFKKNTKAIPPEVQKELKKFITKVKKMSPKKIQPQIFISGGGADPENPNDMTPLADDRYNEICDLLLTQDLIGQLMAGIFIGPDDEIEIIVYWPVPN